VATVQLHLAAKVLANFTHSYKAKCMLRFEETYCVLVPVNTQRSNSDKEIELQVTLIVTTVFYKKNIKSRWRNREISHCVWAVLQNQESEFQRDGRHSTFSSVAYFI
jgi:hypothetical protein